MAELFFFPMYPAEWLAGHATTLMTLEQEGAFLRLLHHSWLSAGVPCSVPDDDESLALLSKMGKRWKVAGAFVKAQFEPVDEYPGNLRNPKLWEVYVEQMEKHSKRVIAGALGGKAKAKRKQKPSNATAMLQQKSSKPVAKGYQLESELEIDTETTKTTTSDSDESGKKSWPFEAFTLWGDLAAPLANVGRISGPLKPVVDKHGWPKVKAGMEAYVVGTQQGRWNLQQFVNNANYWVELGVTTPRTSSGEFAMSLPDGKWSELGRIVNANNRKTA